MLLEFLGQLLTCEPDETRVVPTYVVSATVPPISCAAERSPALPITIVLRLRRPAYIAAPNPVTPAPRMARS